MRAETVDEEGSAAVVPHETVQESSEHVARAFVETLLDGDPVSLPGRRRARAGERPKSLTHRTGRPMVTS